jgi:hypothetical protein
MKYTLSAEALEGYEYEAANTGVAVEDMIQKRISDQGMSFLAEKKRTSVKRLLTKVEKNPEAYRANIEATAAVVELPIPEKVMEVSKEI